MDPNVVIFYITIAAGCAKTPMAPMELRHAHGIHLVHHNMESTGDDPGWKLKELIRYQVSVWKHRSTSTG